MEATILGTVNKRLWCLLDATRVAVEAGDASYPTPLINHHRDRLEADRRGRLGRMVPNGRHRVDRRARRGRRDHQERPGFTAGVLRDLRDHLVLPVRAHRGRQDRDLRALRGNHSLDRPPDGCVRDVVVTRVSILAGTTQSR